jgi:hypothetical protein
MNGKGGGDWLGSGNIAPSDRKFRPFPEAREFVHTLGLKSVKEWGVYRKSGKKPKDIPADPYSSYKGKGWTWMGDWLGTGRVRNQNYRQFIQARKFVHTLALKNQDDWCIFVKSGKKPNDIPADPYYAYKGKGWESWGDWLGTDCIASYNREFRGFTKAKEFVRKLGLANRKQWSKYSISGNRPKDIPSNPDKVYIKEWQGWGDWLGTGSIATHERQYMRFTDAKKYVAKQGIKTTKEWRKFCKSGKKPTDIPTGPSRVYKKEWQGWGDWLGTGSVAPQNRQFRSFEDARRFVHTVGLKKEDDWNEFRKSGKKPIDIDSSQPRIKKH